MSEFHNLNNNQQVLATTNIAVKSSASNNNNNSNLSLEQAASEQELILSKLAHRSRANSIEDPAEPASKVFAGSTELQVSTGSYHQHRQHKHSSSSASSSSSSAGSAASMLSSGSRKQHRHHHHHHHHHQQHQQQQPPAPHHSVSQQHLAGPNNSGLLAANMHHSTSQLSQPATGGPKLLLQQPVGAKQSVALNNQRSRQSHVAGAVDRSDSASLPSSTSTSNSMFKHRLGRDRKWRKLFTCGSSSSSSGGSSSGRLAPLLLLLLLLLLVLLGLALHLRLFGLSISCNLYGASSKQTEGFNLKNGAEFYLGITEMLQAMDSNVDPCHDFYNYACGTWTRRHSIPGDESRIDTFSVMRTDLGNKLKDLLEEELESTDSEATLKAKTLYRSCVNETFIDKRGPEPLIQLLNSQFGGWPLLSGSGSSKPASALTGGPGAGDEVNWVKLMAVLRTYNNEIIIGQTVGSHEHNSSMHAIRLYPAGLGLPSADYYNASSRQFKAYERYLISTAQLLRANNSNLMQDIRDVLEFETGLANISKPFERQGGATYHRMSIARLQKYTPAIDWDTYFQYAFPDLSINGSEQIGLYGLDFFMDIAHLINTTANKRTVINYLLWRFVMNRVNNLGKQFADNQHEYAAEISGAKVQAPRHKVCVDYVNGNMGFAVSSLYVRRHFDASSKQQAEVMIANIRQAFLEILSQVDWMDAETRAEAIVKAKSMLQHIGFPMWIIEPSQLDAEYQHLNFSADHYFENVIQLIQSFAKESRMKLRQPSERDKWTVAPSIINAHYLRTKNLMSFPAGILQPPIYHTRYPKSLNYGGIGSIIGHEITHGFDNDGRHHDYQGNQRLWWHPNTIDRFIIRSQCMVRQYDDYNVEIRGENISVSGIRTLGENIADNGGLKEAFMAYRRYELEHGPEDTLPGLNLTHHQMFFIKFAQNWCQNMTPQSMLNALKTWRHPLGRFRVLGTLSNLNEFSTAFNCPANAPMNPVNKCKVW